jgi:hypothetical protein
MIRIRYILLFIIFCSMLYTFHFFPSNAYASAEWEVTVRVEAAGGYNQLVLGADATATDGYDPLWEVYAKLGGYLEAYFPHPEWDMVHNIFCSDIRAKAPGKTTEWSFVAESSEDEGGNPYLDNYDFTIRWDLSRVPDNYTIFLRDNTTAEQIDMRLATSYSFLYTDSRTFRVTVYVPTDVTPPNPPQGLQGSVIQLVTRQGVRDVVQLAWKRNSEPDLAGYNVYRSTVSGSGYQKINPSLVLSPRHKYTDKKVEKGNTYYYVVTAVNTAGGESGYSNEVRVSISKWR